MKWFKLFSSIPVEFFQSYYDEHEIVEPFPAFDRGIKPVVPRSEAVHLWIGAFHGIS